MSDTTKMMRLTGTRNGRPVDMLVQVKTGTGYENPVHYLKRADGRAFFGTTGYWRAGEVNVESYRGRVLVEGVKLVDVVGPAGDPADAECVAIEERIAAARKARDVAAETEARAALAAVARFEARVIVNAETTYATIGNIKTWAAKGRATLGSAHAAGEQARVKFFAQNPKWAGKSGQRRVRVELVELATGAKVEV